MLPYVAKISLKIKIFKRSSKEIYTIIKYGKDNIIQLELVCN